MTNLQRKKTVLITGVTSGFGTYLAKAFAHAGYEVVLHGRDGKKLQAVKDEIFKKEKVQCATVTADLRKTKELDVVVSAITTRNINILINNAAIIDGDINDVFSTNATSAITLCQEAFKHFTSKNGGTIININSVAGLKGSEREVLYAASKFALRGFSESVKESWLKQGVKMIDVYSGAIATGMSSGRPDVAGLINPQELADFIIGLCGTRSFFVRELNVQKTKNLAPNK